MHCDYCIVGGGIVGLATAWAISNQRPDASIVLLEKETTLAAHQTGHNSGVIHAGIYYAPDSLKARLCREGLDETLEFCRTHEIAHDQCGKLIVATNPLEEQRIAALFERAKANGLDLQQLDPEELKEREPAIRGTTALLSPKTAIVDYPAMARKLADLLRARGASILLGEQVTRIEEYPDRVAISTPGGTWTADRLVVCGGLQADRLARMAGLPIDFRIVPFRGEYFQLPASRNAIIRHLIYPAPDPALPFLGVHLTRMIDGSVTVGPNAVIGFAREGYPKFSLDLADVASFASYPGFWRLVWANRGHAVHELKGSLLRSEYLKECRKYCPELGLDDLQPYRAGIRAQVVMRDGTAMHDFLFRKTSRSVHVCNAPSPAATAALPIGRMIAQELF
ncbi:L-2-hydroxyglutarate oxidase [Novosphingobium sp.]|uniref:L-2-hydroxyglutarate oxidase n=1 Tax=Novosphingobium sp. TaxID=1874826 RepID=UPI0035B2FEAE